MTEHVFGGDWTEIKLNCLKKYLTRYRTIFANNLKAQYFRTWYVDAFAGTGSRAQEAFEGSLLQLAEGYEASRYFEGSARIALSLASPFDRYVFIEKSKARCDELRAMIAREYGGLADR